MNDNAFLVLLGTIAALFCLLMVLRARRLARDARDRVESPRREQASISRSDEEKEKRARYSKHDMLVAASVIFGWVALGAIISATKPYLEEAMRLAPNPSVLFQDPIVGCWESRSPSLLGPVTECFAGDGSYTYRMGDFAGEGYWEQLSDREIRVVATTTLGTTEAHTYIVRIDGDQRDSQQAGNPNVVASARINLTGALGDRSR